MSIKKKQFIITHNTSVSDGDTIQYMVQASDIEDAKRQFAKAANDESFYDHVEYDEDYCIIEVATQTIVLAERKEVKFT